MKVFIDSNVIIAASLAEHVHHAQALRVVEAVHRKEAEGFVSAHSLLETFATLTRLPRTPRISPLQASALIDENVVKHFSVVALSAKEYAGLCKNLGISGICGGKSYDALHLACAEKSCADKIFTFDVRHFSEIASHLKAKIVSP
jgi:predicted nucleic acid-binding protein